LSIDLITLSDYSLLLSSVGHDQKESIGLNLFIKRTDNRTRMSEDTNSTEGYVTENATIATRGWLLLYSVTSGRVSYSSFVGSARELELDRSFVPDIRKLPYAFAVAKENLNGLELPMLETAEGWDGPVERKVKIVSMKKGNEYAVQIENRGRARGRNHVTQDNMLRMEFRPPENFNPIQWRKDYMDKIWKGETKEAEAMLSQIRSCLSVTPYFEDTQIDQRLQLRVAETLQREFMTVAIAIDSKMLRDFIVKVLTGSRIGALPFRSGQGAYFVVRPEDDEAAANKLRQMERYSTLLAHFGNANAITGSNSDSNWLGSDGKPLGWHRPRTNLRIMGYVDDARQMQYIREDIVTNISREVGEYQQKLLDVAQNFNSDKVDDFKKRLNSIEGVRSSLLTRVRSLTSAFGGVELDTAMYRDISESFNGAAQRIQGTSSAVANRLRALADLSLSDEEE
jgi:hypothetical protein